MCEVPSNALLADEFLNHVDGFSIGSNDLLQLTLGVDRDNAMLTGYDERNPAVRPPSALCPHSSLALHATADIERTSTIPRVAKLMERCRGAEEELMGPRENCLVSFGSRRRASGSPFSAYRFRTYAHAPRANGMV